ncbi:hypothetical protein D3C81_1796690 [compost metagenome]
MTWKIHCNHTVPLSERILVEQPSGKVTTETVHQDNSVIAISTHGQHIHNSTVTDIHGLNARCVQVFFCSGIIGISKRCNECFDFIIAHRCISDDADQSANRCSDTYLNDDSTQNAAGS